MKIFIRSSVTLICLAFFASGCSTTPNLDKRFGEASKQSLSAQQIKNSSSGDSVIQARELKSAYDTYIRGGSSTEANSNVQGSMQSR